MTGSIASLRQSYGQRRYRPTGTLSIPHINSEVGKGGDKKEEARKRGRRGAGGDPNELGLAQSRIELATPVMFRNRRGST